MTTAEPRSPTVAEELASRPDWVRERVFSDSVNYNNRVLKVFFENIPATILAPFPVDNHTAPYRCSPGNLSVLPAELLVEISSLLDMRSIINFSNTCSFIRQVIGNIPAVAVVREYAKEALCALQKTKLDSLIRLDQLFEALTTPLCSGCQKTGGYLFIPLCARICFACMHTNPCFAVFTVNSLTNILHRSYRTITAKATTFEGFPGSYGWWGTRAFATRFPQACKLISATHLVSSSLSVDPTILPYQSSPTGTISNGSIHLSYAASIEFPYWKIGMQKPEYAKACMFCCFACMMDKSEGLTRWTMHLADVDEEFLVAHKMFLPEEQLGHVRGCRAIGHYGLECILVW